MAWLGGTALVLGACAGSLGAGVSGAPCGGRWERRCSSRVSLSPASGTAAHPPHRGRPRATGVGAQLRALAFDMGGVKPRGLTRRRASTRPSSPGSPSRGERLGHREGGRRGGQRADLRPPWRLAVTESTDDVLAIELRRNRQLISAQRLDRESLRLTAADLRGTKPTAADGPTTSAATTPSLPRSPRPWPSCRWPRRTANAVGSRVTNWRSVAVQYPRDDLDAYGALAP